MAATVLLIVGLYLILALESTTARRGAWVGALCAALGGVYAVVLILPFGRHFYALEVPGLLSWLAIICGSALAIGGLVLTDNRFIPGLGAPPLEPVLHGRLIAHSGSGGVAQPSSRARMRSSAAGLAPASSR